MKKRSGFVRGKKAQETMGIPFTFIFGMFLIVIFIIIAFIGIKAFLGFQDTSKVGLFYDDFQKEVSSALSSDQTTRSFKIDLPSGILKVCFANLSARINGLQEDYNQIERFESYGANLFLVPPGKAEDLEFKTIKGINITKITERRNPYCLNATGSLNIKKGLYSKLVWIE